MLSKNIRDAFLKFFEKNEHQVIGSSPLVPQHDDTLLFTNAGMVQFKNIFTGIEEKEYKRATTVQKCIRAGGKHNDLDQVGFTARHHTFFEMLGNFSFGDYFKEEAIYLAWNFLTKELSIPKEKLLATVYHSDEESKEIWKKVAGDIRVIPIATSDNFWFMGDVGACGPCSEIFYDHGDSITGGLPGSPDEGDRFVEIWNIVFMQYEQMQNGEKKNLKKQSIDTGMGLERITSVMQGVSDNYQTDIFKEIISEIKNLSGTNYCNTYPSYKVIADHIRSISFLIADGVIPSNEGRGYVLRRILRRAMRHCNMIGIKKPFLFRLSEKLINTMKEFYPELEKAKTTITTSVHSEEEKFLNTLDKGLKILNLNASNIPSGEIMDGSIVFKLYDTYGFPLDLTQDILKTKNISVDIDGFDKALKEQRERAKWCGSGECKIDGIWYTLKEKLCDIDFVGYEKEKASSKVLSIIKDNQEVSSLNDGVDSFLIVSSTPFYSECGGQCGDAGTIKTEHGLFEVDSTLKFCDNIVAHKGKLVSGEIRENDNALLEINSIKRKKIKNNHTATHLLHSALKIVLGEHVSQRGSFLNDERLRFDFSHNVAISEEDITKIENMINGWIFDGFIVSSNLMSKDEAISSGATALFGEKYGDSVRTICVSKKDDEDNVKKISFELCGGTHVKNTSEIGCFKILSESSIGSGIRRIEAITGKEALKHFRCIENSMNMISKELKCIVSEVPQRVNEILVDLKNKNHQLTIYRHKTAVEKAIKTTKKDVDIMSIVVDDYSMNELRSISDFLIKTKKTSNSIMILISSNCDKISVVVSVTSDLQSKYNAGNLLKIALPIIDGKGGGGASFAQGGGVGKSKIEEMINRIIEKVY